MSIQFGESQSKALHHWETIYHITGDSHLTKWDKHVIIIDLKSKYEESEYFEDAGHERAPCNAMQSKEDGMGHFV